MIPEITQQNLHLLLPGKITTLAQFYAEDHGCTMFEAIRHLYASPLYERLADGRDRGQVSVLPIFLRLRARRGFPQDTVLSPVPLGSCGYIFIWKGSQPFIYRCAPRGTRTGSADPY